MPPRLLALGLALPLLALAAGSPAGAEELHLANGDRLTGRVLSLGASTVEVDLGYGVLAVPRARVLRVVLGRAGETTLRGAAVDELLALVEAAPFPFLVDGRRMRGRELAESARMRAHLLGGLADARTFVDRVLARSEHGRPVQALLPGGRKVPLADWLDAAKAGAPAAPAAPATPSRHSRHVRGGAEGR